MCELHEQSAIRIKEHSVVRTSGILDHNGDCPPAPNKAGFGGKKTKMKYTTQSKLAKTLSSAEKSVTRQEVRVWAQRGYIGSRKDRISGVLLVEDVDEIPKSDKPAGRPKKNI